MTEYTVTMNEIAKMIRNKYSHINDYLFSEEAENGLFFKYLATILYLRKRLGYRVETNEPFYTYIHIVDSTVFQNIANDDLDKILQYVIFVACSYIDDQDYFEPEHKKKILTALMCYQNAVQ